MANINTAATRYTPPQYGSNQYISSRGRDHYSYYDDPYYNSNNRNNYDDRLDRRRLSPSRSPSPPRRHRRAHSASASLRRSSSSIMSSMKSDSKHPTFAILAAGTGAAAVATADKYLVRGEKKEESTMRLLADVAVGGLVGYGAYKYYDDNYADHAKHKSKEQEKAKKREKRARRRGRSVGDDDSLKDRHRDDSYDSIDRYSPDDRRAPEYRYGDARGRW